jgi:ferredoxin
MTILDAAHTAGIDIPNLCHIPGRPAKPSCLLCVVKVKGYNRLLPSCGALVADGMVVENNSPEVMAARRTTIEMLLGDHLGDCLGPCSEICPAHLNTPKMMRQIAEGQFCDAIVTVKESIAIPAILGRICPELCEKGCRRTHRGGPVSVCMLKRFVADLDLASASPYLPKCAPDTGKRVAIVGGGPAGLSAAYYLRQYGHQCEIYDARPRLGGMLRYGVSEEALPRDILDKEIDNILRLGITYKCNTRVGGDISLDELRDDYDAVLLTTGDAKTSPPDPSIPIGPRGVDADRSTYRVCMDETSKSPVWAAGAALQTLRHAIRASADGHNSAKSIHYSLTTEDGAETPAPSHREFSVHMGHYASENPLENIPSDALDSRAIPSMGRDNGYTEEEAVREAKRCLSCDCAGAASCRLRGWAQKCGANPNRFKGLPRQVRLDTSHPEVIFDSGKCIACGVCIRIAKSQNGNGISLVGRGFDIEIGSLYNRPISETLKDVARSCAIACPTGALTIRNSK